MTEAEVRRHLREIGRLRKRARRLLWWSRVLSALAAHRRWQVG